MGSTQFRVEDKGDNIVLTVDLDAQVPQSRERVLGQIVLSGPRLSLPMAEGVSSHQWSPKTTAAQGHLSLRHGKESTQVGGRGYFDSNFSSVPLHEQGIESWRWGRLSFEDETFVYYDIAPQVGASTTHVFVQESGGSRKLVPLGLHSVGRRQERLGAYGVSSPRELRFSTTRGDYSISCRHLVDDGPFYQRFLIEGEGPNGARAHGVSEVVIPSRVDLSWQRPFVRMRTHRVGRDNSPFLPLFSGSRVDRVGRMVRSLALLGGVS
jgi:hypothetical protein